jgi:hypothetical protein
VKRKAAFAGILEWSTSLKPREITPQTTSRFPSNHVPFPSDHESISLKPRAVSLRPRVGFPQTTKTAYKWAEARFAGDSGEAVVGTQRV